MPKIFQLALTLFGNVNDFPKNISQFFQNVWAVLKSVVNREHSVF